MLLRRHTTRLVPLSVMLILLAACTLVASGCAANPFNPAPPPAPTGIAEPSLAPVVLETATAVAAEIPTVTPSAAAGPSASVAALATPAAAQPTVVAIPTFTPLPPVVYPPAATPLPPAPSGGFTRVGIYLIAMNDNGRAGPLVGCGDSAVAVARQIQPTNAPLTAALKELLSLHDRFYGQSGLYNALYQSNLQVQKVTLVNGQANIQLVGQLQLGGECDDPRVEAQLNLTALQFNTVRSAAIFLNGKPLRSLLGGRGQ